MKPLDASCSKVIVEFHVKLTGHAKGEAMRAKDNVFRFRSLKWGDQEQKLKMIGDDVGQPRWRLWLARHWEYGVVAFAFGAGILGGILLF